jgi:hypothetical protein
VDARTEVSTPRSRNADPELSTLANSGRRAKEESRSTRGDQLAGSLVG